MGCTVYLSNKELYFLFIAMRPVSMRETLKSLATDAGVSEHRTVLSGYVRLLI